MALDELSVLLGQIEAKLSSLEGWLTDHQEQDRVNFSRIDKKVDLVLAAVTAEQTRQVERNKIAGKIAAGVSAIVSILVAVIGLFVK